MQGCPRRLPARRRRDVAVVRRAAPPGRRGDQRHRARDQHRGAAEGDQQALARLGRARSRPARRTASRRSRRRSPARVQRASACTWSCNGGASVSTSSNTVAIARPAISVSAVSSAVQPVVPPSLENARPMPLKRFSIVLGTWPPARSASPAGAGPYHGRSERGDDPERGGDREQDVAAEADRAHRARGIGTFAQRVERVWTPSRSAVVSRECQRALDDRGFRRRMARAEVGTLKAGVPKSATEGSHR